MTLETCRASFEEKTWGNERPSSSRLKQAMLYQIS
jgi:hypothetical protein